MPNVFPDDILRRLRELEKRVAGTISLWGAVANAQFTNEGDPNGLVAGAVGDVLVDTATPELWQNVDGATGWLPFPHYWGSAETAQFYFGGDPNGIITAESIGDLLIDGLTPALYQNTDGATAWQLIGSGGFPITEDDGTTTARIDFNDSTAHGLDISLTTDAGSIKQTEIRLTNGSGLLFDDLVGNGIGFSSLGGAGASVYFDIFDSTGAAFQVTDNDAGGILLISNGTGGEVSLQAAGTGGVVDLTGTAKILLGSAEVLFEGCNAAPTSADLANGDFGFWFDPVTHVLSAKGRDSGGTIRNLAIGTLT